MQAVELTAGVIGAKDQLLPCCEWAVLGTLPV
jgi:hypothetical protein